MLAYTTARCSAPLIAASSTHGRRTTALVLPLCRRRFSNDGDRTATAAASSTTTTTTSTSPPDVQEPRVGEKAHVHPLSQIVLERLQDHHAPFLVETGLDRGLSLNKDGTFVLRFSSPMAATMEENTTTKKSTKEEEEDVDNEIGEDRIWTSYESSEKKHWLCLKKDRLVGRYLLQDNMKPAWHSSRVSLPEKVKGAVDKMVDKISVGVEAEK